jgi:hypothetical protein
VDHHYIDCGVHRVNCIPAVTIHTNSQIWQLSKATTFALVSSFLYGRCYLGRCKIYGTGQRVANFKIADIFARNYKKIADF